MVRPWVGWLCILIFISMVFYLYLSINAPIIRNPYLSHRKFNIIQSQEFQKIQNFNLLNNFKVKDCKTVHIATVCAGYNSTVTLVTTVKSILFHRKKPLHFHLLVDNIAFKTLTILFNTWNLPFVTISYYKIEEYTSRISWIPNTHYSGVYGLLKIILPEAINESNVIVLDTDITILNDISILWELFQNFNKDQLFGLVENQSNWYLKVSPYGHPWPAIGKGFNTGVILMNLQGLRNKKFYKLWEDTTKQVLQTIPFTSLADQDIINAVLKFNPQFLYKIDCTWNVQLSDHTLSEICYDNADQINIIHWNSPRKQSVKNKHVQDFRKMHQVFLELDGNLLKRRLFGCHINEEIKENNELDPCFKFKDEAKIIYRTHIFFLEYEYKIVNPFDVFIATQCSIDRIVLLEELSRHWPGVISIALYLTDAEVQIFLNFVQNSAELKNRKNIAYHIVYKEGDFYPINYLRNVAMKYIELPYVFQLDIDFLPPIGLYQNIMNNIIQQNLTQSNKVAFVIPAFETQRYRFTFPTSKSELLKYLNYGILYTFRYHVWSQGHASTNYTYYRNATEPYKISWEPDYEPYIVLSKSSPIYDTRFIGFGWNKVSYITHLTAIGYEYFVLPDAFIIHRPHAPSRDIEKFRIDISYRRCLKKLKDEFILELIKKYGDLAVMNLKKIFAKENKTLQNNTIQKTI